MARHNQRLLLKRAFVWLMMERKLRRDLMRAVDEMARDDAESADDWPTEGLHLVVQWSNYEAGLLQLVLWSEHEPWGELELEVDAMGGEPSWEEMRRRSLATAAPSDAGDEAALIEEAFAALQASLPRDHELRLLADAIDLT
jgi:hypothetical protein